MTSQTFHIGGMTCQGCVKSVQSVLTQLQGVQQVVVSLADNTAIVDFDEQLIQSPTIVETIENAGFDVISPQ